MRNAKRKTIFIFILVLLVAFLFGSSVYLRGVLSDLTAVFEEFISRYPFFAPVAFVLLAAVSVLLGPFSSAPIAPLVVTVWGTAATLLLLLFGWLLGGCASYAIGRYAGYPLVEKIAGRRRLEGWMLKLKPRMNFLLLFLFRLATPSETGYVFGIFRYDFWRYLLITFLAELPFALLVVYASGAFIEADWRMFAILFLIGAAAAALIYYLFERRLENKE
ncbi:VTT domain-containing protein [Patescibacteria group bacterium]|nr:VTT domain-containing protein [Patescibacteria group bacterium]MBU4141898.1 VTT domain-containing protein [Patescibacteria group bacterium]